VLTVAIVGCGESSEAPRPAATAIPDRRATVEPTQVEIRKVANAYVRAWGRKDWEAVCGTLVPSERRYFDRLGGSCERVYRQGRSGKRVHRLVRDSIAGEIRIGPKQAVIEITEAGSPTPYMRLYAIQENGRWGIARSFKRRAG
jgi:hypothetical protein